jgi:hypothetical protein
MRSAWVVALHSLAFACLAPDLALAKPAPDGQQPVFGVSGVVSKDGSAELSPVQRLRGRVDRELGHFGAYEWVYLDARGKVLASLGFDLGFRTSDGNEVDAAPLSMLIPYVLSTKRLLLKHRGKTLADVPVLRKR